MGKAFSKILMKIVTSSYKFFDVNILFKTNSETCYNEFQKVFGYFKSTSSQTDITCSIEKSDGTFHISAKSKRYSLSYKTTETPNTDTYLSLFGPVIYEVKDFFLIHAGSLNTPDGKSIFISAPSGFGKTTLTKALQKQGFKLLSDELAPLNIRTGLIHPYPRGMGVIEGNTKKIIEIPKNILGNTCKPGYVIFIALEKDHGDETEKYFEIALGRINEDIINSFKQIPGVKKITIVHDRMFPMLRLLLEKETPVVAKIQEICDHKDIPIIYTQRGKTEAPDFTAEPKVKQIPVKEGVFELSQNILNAHNSALLEEIFSGSRPKMIFELAGLMNQVKFFTITPGKLDQMVELVKNICKTKKN